MKIYLMQTEATVLRISIAVSLLVSALGIGFGLLSGSFSITFDGVYSLLDSAMSLLTLFAARLITSYATDEGISERLKERFTMGFWHLEPLILALNGSLLIALTLYALINAVSSLLAGGRALEFGWAIGYAMITLLLCSVMGFTERRANRRLQSDFIRLDMLGWVMSAGITAALLVAFSIGYLVEGTAWAWIAPYVDPAVLSLVCLVLIVMPVSTVRKALADILRVTPAELKAHVDEVATATCETYGFLSYRAYVSRMGRARKIELYFVVPEEGARRHLREWDALRSEISEALGEAGPDRWLSIVFTTDSVWAD